MSGDWMVSGVPVVLRRSARRRTVALQVKPGAVTLYAPTRIPLEKLQQVVQSRREWIAHHLHEYAQRPTSALTYTDGSSLPFIGEHLTLKYSSLRQVRREGATLLVPAGDAQAVQAQVERWTRRACLTPYRVLVEEYASQLGALPRLGKVGISTATQRWGSCNSGGHIRLHWKLSRAPLEVLHYVALHEAAHLRELNHSPAYWAHVRRIMPDFDSHRRWLKEHGSTL